MTSAYGASHYASWFIFKYSISFGVISLIYTNYIFTCSSGLFGVQLAIRLQYTMITIAYRAEVSNI